MTPGDDSHEDGCVSAAAVVVVRVGENVLRMSRMSGNREASVGGGGGGGGGGEGVHIGCGLDTAVILGGGGGMRENMAGGVSIYVA